MDARSIRAGDRSDTLAAVLRREIVSGAIAPGASLRQEGVARRLNASRIPLREALRTLAAEGLVWITPNRGAVVAGIDPDELREVTDMRIALEGMAIRLAVPRLSDDRIDAAARLQDEIEDGGDGAFASLNARFHMTLYDAADRPLLLRQVANLHALSERYLHVAVGAMGLSPRSSREHRALIDAARARDADRAVAVLSDHVLAPGRAVEARMRAG